MGILRACESVEVELFANSGALLPSHIVDRYTHEIGDADHPLKIGRYGCSVDQDSLTGSFKQGAASGCKMLLISSCNTLRELHQFRTMRYAQSSGLGIAVYPLNVDFGVVRLRAHPERRGVEIRSVEAFVDRRYASGHQFHLHAVNRPIFLLHKIGHSGNRKILSRRQSNPVANCLRYE